MALSAPITKLRPSASWPWNRAASSRISLLDPALRSTSDMTERNTIQLSVPPARMTIATGSTRRIRWTRRERRRKARAVAATRASSSCA